ncbi:MAG: DUF134 domain-containing protein [Bacteroidales bacterium]|nr:DUF134 domain-containing protein [Bacteroidales bacterium]
MPRPKKERRVHKPPFYTRFKPTGIAAKDLKQLTLSLDEYEAIRLADFYGMSQEEAAEEMEISRPTFTRLIEQARKKMADFLINGKVLILEGGNIHFKNNVIRCEDCGHMFTTSLQTIIQNCPNCDSSNLTNLAGGFGHGRCCIK